MTGDILNFINQVGVPITVALAAGGFLFIILKFLLAQVTSSIEGLSNSLLSLENKCDTMNNVEPNLDRIAASEGKEDCRDD